MSQGVVLERYDLEGGPWRTADPFLFCVHHLDHYPAGDEHMGPAASLAGRSLGMDFSGKDGWSMYHGERVPGFPRHPHRGFETVTIARQGFIDHADSLGATARFGRGDVQWMTAGEGVVHSEMFPLLDREGPNTLELFQIWLNLPASHKLVEPSFKMLWHEDVPELAPASGVEVRVIAGALGGERPPAPPPNSWAAGEEAKVAIWTLRLEPGASWEVPAAAEGLNRSLFVFQGDQVEVAGQPVPAGTGLRLDSARPAPVENTGEAPVEGLLLQGRPLDEPVAQRGPFVMSSPGQLRQAMLDYQRTGFGGWPWGSPTPVHARDQGRFAVHADGRREER